MSVEFVLDDMVYGEVYPCGPENRLPDYTEGSFVALDAETGEQRWDRDVIGFYSGAFGQGPPSDYANVFGVGSAAIVVKGLDGSLHGLEPGTGDLLWKQQLESRSVEGGNRELVVVATPHADPVPPGIGSGQLDAYERRTGTVRWTWRPPDGWLGTQVVVGDEAVVVATFNRLSLPPDGGAPAEVALRVIDPRSGRERWQLPAAVESLYDPVVSIGPVLVVQDPTGVLRGYEPATGRQMWEADPDIGDAQLAPTHPPLLFSSLDGPVIRLDPADGSVRWRVSAGTQGGPLAISGNTVVVSSEFTPQLLAIDARSGRTTWKRPDAPARMQSSAIGEGVLAVAGGCDLL